MVDPKEVEGRVVTTANPKPTESVVSVLLEEIKDLATRVNNHTLEMAEVSKENQLAATQKAYEDCLYKLNRQTVAHDKKLRAAEQSAFLSGRRSALFELATGLCDLVKVLKCAQTVSAVAKVLREHSVIAWANGVLLKSTSTLVEIPESDAKRDALIKCIVGTSVQDETT